jgi:linoleoyl-CoA desaturase
MEAFKLDHRSAQFNEIMGPFLKEYFRNKKQTGNGSLYVKATILLGSLFALIVVLSITTQPLWLEITECIVLGIVIAGIGFSIMHDAVHGSFSSSKTYNLIFSYTLNLLGGYWPIWKAQHNADHHMNTNINGKERDGDIDLGILGRLHPHQKLYWAHRFQYIYLPWIMYPLSYLAWIYIFDFIKAKKLKFSFWQYVSLVISKLIHMCVFIGFPLLFRSGQEVFWGYFIATTITGTITSFVFQLAHVVEITEMLEEPENGKVTRDVVHQLRTTANFATNNRLLFEYTGGLNFQIEHHLYYKISHVHYRRIAKETKNACMELNLPYHEYPTLISAVRSHIRQLKKLGK